MTSQHLCFQNLRSVLGSAPAGLGLVVLLGKLEGVACLFTWVFGLAAKTLPAWFPCLFHAACHVVQVYALGHIPYCSLALESFRCVVPALHVIAAAV
jgi:hypothetical protein